MKVTAVTMLADDTQDFAASHRNEILSLTGKTFVPVQLGSEWILVPGIPKDGWANRIPARNRTRFQLTPDLDLDTLVPGSRKMGDEAVLYNRFFAPSDGIGLIGIGTDWWFDARVNGQLCGSTWKTGNEEIIYDPENHPFYIPVKKGENLLTVRVRRGASSWCFTCAPLSFRMIPYPAVLQGPWLTHPDADGISIRFFTAGKIAAGVDYRRTGTKTWKTVWDHAHGQIRRAEFHAVHLSGLRGEASYEYRIVMLDPADLKNKVYSPTRKFRLPGRRKEKFSFFFTADLQFPVEKQHKILRSLFGAAQAETCDFIVFGGDIGMTFSMKQMTDFYLPEIGAMNDGTIPLVPIRGNHELRGDDTELMPEYFAGPNGLTCGIFRYGDTAFLILDCLGDHQPGTSQYSMRDLDTVFFESQKSYLENVLRLGKWTGARRRIVLSHSAPYSHADKRQTITANLKTLTDPWFAGKNPLYKVDLWLTGHVHRYMRSIPGTDEVAAEQKPKDAPVADGRDYIFPVLTVAGPNQSGLMEASAFRIDADRDKLLIRAFSPNGKCFEQVEIAPDGAMKEIISLPHFKNPQTGRNGKTGTKTRSTGKYPLIAAVEQFSSRVLILDPNLNPLLGNAIVWQWSPMHDWDLDAKTVRTFCNLSEVKPVFGGTRLLVTASGGACTLLDLQTKKAGPVLYAGGNPHSADLLPDGNIVTASSYGYLRLFDLKKDPGGQIYRDYPQESAHGVVFSPSRKRLYSSGKDGLICWQYDPDQVVLIKKAEYQFNLPDARFGGHDLSLDPVSGKFIITGRPFTLRFDPDTGKTDAKIEIPHIKSAATTSGQPTLLMIPDERWWSTRLRLLHRDGTISDLLDIPHFRFYKARWFDYAI